MQLLKSAELKEPLHGRLGEPGVGSKEPLALLALNIPPVGDSCQDECEDGEDDESSTGQVEFNKMKSTVVIDCLGVGVVLNNFSPFIFLGGRSAHCYLSATQVN